MFSIMRRRRAFGVAAAAAALTALSALVLAARTPARASAVEGCQVNPVNGSTDACHFGAHAPDEIVAIGAIRWRVTIQRGKQTQYIGEGDTPTCFLEGSLYSDRQMALCSGRIQPGDAVTVEAQGTGTVTVSNAVCDHDPLCREP